MTACASRPTRARQLDGAGSISPEDFNALVASAERHRARVAREERIRLAERAVIEAARRLVRAETVGELEDAELVLHDVVCALDEAEASQ